VEVAVLVACWSVKGGVGTTVVAAAVALHLAQGDAPGVVLADLAGDAPAVLGLPEPASPGLAGWLSAGAQVPADALARLEIEVAPGLRLLARGSGPLLPGRAEVLAAVLDRSPRTSVVDCGRAGGPVASALIGRAQQSLLVTRPCYVALRRAMQSPVRPTGVVVVNEPGRVLSSADVERAAKAPVVAEVQVDPSVARLVDAGLLTGRLPRSLDPLRVAA
jgi:MinD superfamily P-loop ATPase